MIKYLKNLEKPGRIITDKDFPAYTFVPGLAAHPERDPGGHSYNKTNSDSIMYSDTNWQSSDAYKFGFDLFNFGYYWEAHESWEKIWQLLKTNHNINHYLKGLIKISAAGVKVLQKNIVGYDNHMTKAAKHFKELSQLHGEKTRDRFYYSELYKFTQEQIARKNLLIRKDFEPPDNVFGVAIYPK